MARDILQATMLRLNAGEGATHGGLHSIRIVMTPADYARLTDRINVTSNQRLAATIIYNEREVFVRCWGPFERFTCRAPSSRI